ncbi:hypothetical protein [Chitinophaga varians]|nr:hypothetical protein [Chitinophaga varians]
MYHIIPVIVVITLGMPMRTSGQSHPRKTTEESSSKKQTMDISEITHPAVRKAIEALQAGDKSWYSFFTDHPAMTDDGNTVDFKSFFAKALGNEKFLSVDKVENGGKDIYGNFKAGSWGTFKVFFKFHEGPAGKFDRLDIGQATY